MCISGLVAFKVTLYALYAETQPWKVCKFKEHHCELHVLGSLISRRPRKHSLGVSEIRGLEYSTRISRVLIIMTPKIRHP